LEPRNSRLRGQRMSQSSPRASLMLTQLSQPRNKGDLGLRVQSNLETLRVKGDMVGIRRYAAPGATGKGCARSGACSVYWRFLTSRIYKDESPTGVRLIFPTQQTRIPDLRHARIFRETRISSVARGFRHRRTIPIRSGQAFDWPDLCGYLGRWPPRNRESQRRCLYGRIKRGYHYAIFGQLHFASSRKFENDPRQWRIPTES
jgi:hypothetical protein